MIRVLVVDDSLFMRQALRKLLASDPRLTVVGEARDGHEALELTLRLHPHVVTMDFNMPGMTGAEAVRAIMRARPTPIVMLSAHTRAGASETLEALAAGAVDFLAKPSGEVSADFSRLQTQLLAKVVTAAQATLRGEPPCAEGERVSRGATDPGAAHPAAPRNAAALGRTTWSGLGPRVVVVAISTGGPAALSRFLPMLPSDTPCGLVIVQHMPAEFTGPLAERLAQLCAIDVREAKSGERPRQGLALIAPGDQHLDFHDGGSVRVHDGPEVNGCRPSADVTMRAAARVFGRRAIGVIMTGMGKDGAEGMAAIKAAGGTTVAQDQGSSVIFGMPRAAIETGVVDHVAALDGLAGLLGRIVGAG
jgi:two-component system chemotaxis response regulator CheB